MGRDRRIVDSNAQEMLILAAVNGPKVALYGSTDAGTTWVPVAVDASGKLKVTST